MKGAVFMTTKTTQLASGMADIANIALCDIALEKAMARTSTLPGLVCFYGPTGFGKSVSAAWVANRRRAYYVQAKSVWTRKHTLKSILGEMGIKPGATLPEMADQIAEELAASGRPLIIDEMDHLVASGQVELIRDLYESSQAYILLIGEEWLPTKLKKYERFHGRILSWIPAQPVSMDDARELVKIYSSSVVIADDLLTHLVNKAMGSVRRVAVNLELLAEAAAVHGRIELELADLQRLNLELYTGAAPNPRTSK
ncbi:TPA: ATP-binding protein [Pseudomonas aeruginosa]|uniref:AAA family ATPase n=1 Tax=Pseudomonas aeruginosa TaxID=287 RepID=UPI000BB52E7F|nr:ATP-binding protein [Pseudomonas aeruginosa]ELM1739321.1 ATP-binding protein [Pseudomonas aeruginosa]PBL37399.1 DNA transposition protein [Pseudomonas aeruginosa]PBM57674.1 DNA transposition protein [Pseudomonas aeruginosa]HDP3470265.1 ATP-binding protein [Pseudomonas aeruginosa]